MARPPAFLMIVSAYPPAKKAGMERGCQRLAEALVRLGCRVCVLTQQVPDMPISRVEHPGIEVHRAIRPLALGPLWGLTYMQQIRQWMLTNSDRWDFCLCHKLYLHSIAAAMACRALRRPCTTLLVNAGAFSDILMLRRHRFGEWLLRQALRQDAFFALSQRSARELQELGVDSARVLPYRYFVDVSRFRPDPVLRRHVSFLYVGRFHEQKNLPLLVESFALVHGQNPEARLVMVGSGPAEKDVRAAVEASPARAAIELRGWADDPRALYQGHLAVVTASNAEGLSNVLLEAMACGAPVITTDVSGAREALDLEDAPSPLPPGDVTVGRGGLLVPCGDAQALAAAMGMVLRRAEMATRLGAQARARIEAEFAEQVTVPAFLAHAGRIAAGYARP